jgi:hypothetical protein
MRDYAIERESVNWYLCYKINTQEDSVVRQRESFRTMTVSMEIVKKANNDIIDDPSFYSCVNKSKIETLVLCLLVLLFLFFKQQRQREVGGCKKIGIRFSKGSTQFERHLEHLHRNR